MRAEPLWGEVAAGAGEVCPAREAYRPARATMRDVTAFAAHLRVYEPLAAFDRDERRHWEQYLRAGNMRRSAS